MKRGVPGPQSQFAASGPPTEIGQFHVLAPPRKISESCEIGLAEPTVAVPRE